MFVCAGTGEAPVTVTTKFVQLDQRGNVFAVTNELGAEGLGYKETREFGKCPGCPFDFELVDGRIRFHHSGPWTQPR
ncbi:MAG TPA: hypothetical protein VFG15_03330 [Amycolatopsis sp.]|nr:hypothetical protein [Amycolatopsis sp.]